MKNDLRLSALEMKMLIQEENKVIEDIFTKQGTKSKRWKRNQMEICGGCGKLLDGQKYFYCQNTSCNHKKCETCFKKCFENKQKKGRDKKVSSRLVEV